MKYNYYIAQVNGRGIHMLDLKMIRNNFEEVKKALEDRNEDFNLDVVIEFDEKRRAILLEVEQLQNKRNVTTKEIATLKKEKKNADDKMEEMKSVSARIKELEAELSKVEAELENALLTIPNIPHPSVPKGTTDEDNIEIRNFGEPRKFDFELKPHWDLGTNLDILDFERGAKVSGARFAFFKGDGARLERAITSFFLDVHRKQGYTEIAPPYMVLRQSMVGTGQLPKFEEDAYKTAGDEYFLIPTAEVPVTNYHRDEVLEKDKMPIKYAAYSACFRSEAGSAGRDTRGLVRQHQFDKVEIVKFTEPQNSYDELESLVLDAEEVLQLLGLPYRVVSICLGDLGFTAAKKYDIEVWMPSYGRYVEISSCSNFESFQSRRANIKYRPENGSKLEYVHTLNGSGVAVGRTFAAILENYQNADGSITVPEVLRPFLGGLEVIK
jgi:seryl-tRNA synthetase